MVQIRRLASGGLVKIDSTLGRLFEQVVKMEPPLSPATDLRLGRKNLPLKFCRAEIDDVSESGKIQKRLLFKRKWSYRRAIECLWTQRRGEISAEILVRWFL